MLILISWLCVILWEAESAVLDPALFLLPSPPMTGETPLWSEKRIERDTQDLSVIPIRYGKVTYQATGPTRPTSFSSSKTTLNNVPSTKPIAAHLTTSSSNAISSAVSPLSTSFDTVSLTTASFTSNDVSTVAPSTPKALSTTPLPLNSLPSTLPSTAVEQDSMESAETFWPGLRTSVPYFGINVPLTFGLSGTYGRYGAPPVDGSGVNGVISTSYVITPNKDGIYGLYGNTGLYGKSGLAGSSYGSYAGYGTRIYGGQSGTSWGGWGNGKWGHYGKG